MRGARITIMTAQGVFQRAMPPEAFRRAAFSIDMQTRLDPADAEDALLRCGYSRAVQVEARASSRAAAAYSTSSPPPISSPCAWSSGATR